MIPSRWAASHFFYLKLDFQSFVFPPTSSAVHISSCHLHVCLLSPTLLHTCFHSFRQEVILCLGLRPTQTTRKYTVSSSPEAPPQTQQVLTFPGGPLSPCSPFKPGWPEGPIIPWETNDSKTLRRIWDTQQQHMFRHPYTNTPAFLVVQVFLPSQAPHLFQELQVYLLHPEGQEVLQLLG